MTTTLAPEFLRAVCLMVGFKPQAMVRAQAALLLIGLRQVEFTAADLPGEVAGQHISGAATGALISQGLLTVIRRARSPNPNAKGRKLDVVRLSSVALALTWLRANGIEARDPTQPDLPLGFPRALTQGPSRSQASKWRSGLPPGPSPYPLE